MQNPLLLSTITDNTLTFEFGDVREEVLTHMRSYEANKSEKYPAEFRREAKKLVSKKLQDASGDYAASLAKILHQIDHLDDSKIRNAFEVAVKEFAEDIDFSCRIGFQRTLRLPDDGKVHPLPAGIGEFPIRSLDSLSRGCPREWATRGGAIMPMYQSEAMWISFRGSMPCAIRLIAGSVDALTGEADEVALTSEPQNYLVRPQQPWIDGFKVDSHTVRQFVAMPVGKGHTVSEQLEPTKFAAGLTIEVIPLRAGLLFQEAIDKFSSICLKNVMNEIFGLGWDIEQLSLRCRPACAGGELRVYEDMGLAAGGKIQQEIYRDKRGVDAWDQDRCVQTVVHVCNAVAWTSITGELPPYEPIKAVQYRLYRIPWFDFYRDDMEALTATKKMAGVKSLGQLQAEEGISGDPDDDIDPQLIIQYGNARRPETVRTWGREFARS